MARIAGAGGSVAMEKAWSFSWYSVVFAGMAWLKMPMANYSGFCAPQTIPNRDLGGNDCALPMYLISLTYMIAVLNRMLENRWFNQTS